MLAVAGRPSSSRAAGPFQPCLGRRPAQPSVCRWPARPGGDSWLCLQNSKSCCLAGSTGRPGLVARSGTRCDSIRAPDRGGKRGRRGSRRGRGRGGEGQRGEGGKRHGQLEAHAVAGPSLHAWAAGLKCRRACRAAPARAQSQAGAHAELS